MRVPPPSNPRRNRLPGSIRSACGFAATPMRLLNAAISVARVTHIDASTVVGAAAIAGAVAASSSPRSAAISCKARPN